MCIQECELLVLVRHIDTPKTNAYELSIVVNFQNVEKKEDDFIYVDEIVFVYYMLLP